MRHLTVFSLMALLLPPVVADAGFRWRADVVDEIRRPVVPEADSMGGITWVSNNVYWTVTDEKLKPVVWELELSVDAATGKLGLGRMQILCRPQGGRDIEGIARDPLDGSVWLVDEKDNAVKQYDPVTGHRLPGRAELPAMMARAAKDLGLESITISRDGLSMWTCPEETLTPDGSVSTRRQGAKVRLTRLTRSETASPWRPVGQWVYRTDPIAGKPWYDKKGENMARSGVSELCVLEDGTLLVLEREFSKVLVPRIRCRIYETDFASATEVTDCPSLKSVPGVKAVEKRLLCETTGFAMYEGMCVGPKLADGSHVLLLISDGDEKAFRNVLSVRLSPCAENLKKLP